MSKSFAWFVSSDSQFPPRKRLCINAGAAIMLVSIAGNTAASIVSPSGLEAVEGDTSTALPFSFPSEARSQSLYPATDFPGPVLIQEISYRQDDIGGFVDYTITDIQINLSTFTGATLSPTFVDNIGSDDTVVFDRGALHLIVSGGSSPNPFDLVIAFDTPFSYDPAVGNLLVDIRKFSSEFEVINFDAESTDTVATMGATDVNSSTGNFASSRVLIAKFEVAPIPEPTTFTLLSLSTMALGMARWRR